MLRRRPPPSGQPCVVPIGGVCPINGANEQGTWTKTGCGTFSVIGTSPLGTVVGGLPAIFVPTTAGLQGFPCAPVGVGAGSVPCIGSTGDNGLHGSMVTVVFAAGVTSSGTVSGLGAALPLLPPPPPPIILPPPPPPPLVPLPARPLATAPQCGPAARGAADSGSREPVAAGDRPRRARRHRVLPPASASRAGERALDRGPLRLPDGREGRLFNLIRDSRRGSGPSFRRQSGCATRPIWRWRARPCTLPEARPFATPDGEPAWTPAPT